MERFAEAHGFFLVSKDDEPAFDGTALNRATYLAIERYFFALSLYHHLGETVEGFREHFIFHGSGINLRL